MASSFVWRGYQNNGHQEPETHKRARLRVANLVYKLGKTPIYNKAIKLAEGWTVYPDILIEGDAPVTIELDGASHNTTEQKHDKDQNRDRALAEKGIRTVRLSVEDINGHSLKSGGYFKLTDLEIYSLIK